MAMHLAELFHRDLLAKTECVSGFQVLSRACRSRVNNLEGNTAVAKTMASPSRVKKASTTTQEVRALKAASRR